MKMDLLDIYSDYLISQNHDVTATSLTAMFDSETSHFQINKHRKSGEHGSKERWCHIKPEVRCHVALTQHNANLSKSPATIIRIQSNHLFAPIIASCKLGLLTVKTAINNVAIKQKLRLKANQMMFNELQLLKAVA